MIPREVLAGWGTRLSDRVREALAEGRLGDAERLVRTGDGEARSLAKEYALMYKGLGITVRILLDLAGRTAMRGDERAQRALAELLQRFRADLGRLLETAYGPSATRAAIPDLDELAGARTDGLSGEAAAAAALVTGGEKLFDAGQAALAEQVLEAIAAGDAARARSLVDARERDQYVPLHDRLVRFMAEVFGYVAEHFGSDELHRFHRATAEAQRRGFDQWERLDAAGLTRATAFLAKQHMGRLEVREDDEKFTIVQTPCGSGGRLRLSGVYEGEGALPFVPGPGPLTFGQERLPVYCTHCPVWNSLAPIEWYGHPQLVFDDPARPDGSCTLHVYKDPARVPAACYDLLGAGKGAR